ncbi:hypothetical protein HMPREF9102_0958 [Limosilactobacillus oris F0423]|uniref:Uncharacterized protein n=3 Tax=Limosilactobacillus oris TaxID=1632 RepID=A0A0R1WD24_9LACO|nr:hypothetical protein HMPREF9265_1952 [Limosilactobacillus oris PB013-T2-3]EGS35961.1 hypothetical protein HMPREF9102_0958 [Limosilactobacillus oris F0423]KRM15824.1 hypothetical protein FC49_GL001741 [Limosilactobacillus oris DSM 4864]
MKKITKKLAKKAKMGQTKQVSLVCGKLDCFLTAVLKNLLLKMLSYQHFVASLR